MPDIQTAMKQALTRTLADWDDDDEGASTPAPSVQPVSISLSAPSQNIQGIPMTKPVPQTKQLFAIKNNVSRETFNYVRDNPGSKRKEILTELEYKGFGRKSTAALLSQMSQNKMIHVTNGLYYADIPEYVPIKTGKALKKAAEQAKVQAVKPKRKYTKRDTSGIAALQAKIESIATPSSDALDAAAYAMGGQHRIDKPFLTKLVRTKSPESIVENMNVLQARELYDYLKKLFGG